MARRLLWASLALAPITWIVDAVAHPGKVVLFVLASLSLIPLAWLIGEATEHAGEHTGPRIGGLLNASFGNAPEVIIALIAIADNLPDVVRGSLAGSVVSNILLVLGAALVLGHGRRRARAALPAHATRARRLRGSGLPDSLRSELARRPEPAHRSRCSSIGPAIVLLVVYLLTTVRSLRQRPPHEPERSPGLEPALVARRARARDGRDGGDRRDPRPLARGVRRGGEPVRVLHLRRDRRDRRQCGGARRRRRHRAHAGR